MELDTPTGKNDGTVQGIQYFDCRPKHGIFVRVDKLILDKRGRAMRELKKAEKMKGLLEDVALNDLNDHINNVKLYFSGTCWWQGRTKATDRRHRNGNEWTTQMIRVQSWPQQRSVFVEAVHGPEAVCAEICLRCSI